MFNKLKYKIFFTNIYIQNKLKRLRKTALAFIMVVAMLIGLIPHITSKIESLPSDYWTATGNYSTAWYSSGPSTYTINTAQDLAGLAILVNGGNNFSGKTINLSANIDLSAHLWTPIGAYDANPANSKPFKGTFDGQNRIINGLTINNTSASIQGLFGITTSSSIKNIGLTNTNISAKAFVGSIVGTNDSSQVLNCYNGGSVSGVSDQVGGIAGRHINNSTMTNCYNTGSVSGTSSNVGGITGSNDSSTISNCYNIGNIIKVTNNGGGITGYNYSSQISNCYNTGNVIGSGNSHGGIAGSIPASTITNCYNTGSVSGAKNWIGGIVGYNFTTSGTVSNCYNEGSVTGTGTGTCSSVGGIVGLNFYTVSNCYNRGSVSGYSGVGGIVGDNGYGSSPPKILTCYNTGSVSGTSSNVGGIIGRADRSQISNCYNTKSVTGGSPQGGIFGANASSTFSNCFYLSGTTSNSATGIASATIAQLQGNASISLTSNGFSKSPFYDTNNFNEKYLVLNVFNYGDTVLATFTGTSFVYDGTAKTPTFNFPSTSTIGRAIMPINPGMRTFTYTGISGTSYGPTPNTPTQEGTYNLAVNMIESSCGYTGTSSTNFTIGNPALPPAKSSTTPTYSQSGRSLSKLTSGISPSLAADGSYTMQFSTNEFPANRAVNHKLNFDKALPVGTRLTFVDHSSATPNYYYYNITSVTPTLIALSSFNRMGTTSNNNYTDPGSPSSQGKTTEILLFVIDFSQVASGSRLNGSLNSTLQIDGLNIDQVAATIGAASSGSISNTPGTTNVSIGASSGNQGSKVFLAATITNVTGKPICLSKKTEISGTYNNNKATFTITNGGLAVLDLGVAQSTTTNYNLSGSTISGLPSGTYNLKLSVCVTSSSNASYPTKDIKASLAIPITIQA